ncbi:hypothetical protein AB0M12_23350 [Nocardia vinacea]|uniref:hypothetical protein n=1 Tax=Nocardia vinacea TaxID=96468 RepID=UPI0034332C06
MCPLRELERGGESPPASAHTASEHLRDLYDRSEHGLLSIGMPGIEKTFSRYPQLYSRVGFADHYRPLTGEELTFGLNRHRHKLGLELDPDDFIDTRAPTTHCPARPPRWIARDTLICRLRGLTAR